MISYTEFKIAIDKLTARVEELESKTEDMVDASKAGFDDVQETILDHDNRIQILEGKHI